MIKKSEADITKNWHSHLSKPIVSICCITYNHEKYIKEALNGFLMQQTTFPFEIIVRDDCSTDQTAKIIREYFLKYPHIIKPIFEKENTFKKGIKPLQVALKIAVGKYVALCEGDDYWCSEDKLQMQIDFLEKNKEYSMIFHKAKRYDENQKLFISSYPNLEDGCTLDIDDFLNSNYAPTASIVRRNISFEYPINFNKFKPGDWPTNIITASNGKVKYISNEMSVYRIHNKGVWNGTKEIKNNKYTIYMLEEMNKYFKNKYSNSFNQVIIKQIYQQIKFHIKDNNIKKAFLEYNKLLKNYNINFKVRVQLFFKLYVNLFLRKFK